MSLLYIYRIITFVLVMIVAIIVIALGAQTTKAHNSLQQQLNAAGAGFKIGDDFSYAGLGVAVGALTLISFPIMLVLDFLKLGAFRATAIVEVIWLPILWLLYIVTSALTFSKADYSVFPSCDFLRQIPELVTTCKDAKPIGVLSAIAAVLLFLYWLALIVTTAVQSGRGRSQWGESVKDAEKA